MEPKRYWIFQYKYRSPGGRWVESAKPGDTIPWVVTRYKSRIREGDVTFFWQAGKVAGIKGWGIVASPVSESDSGTPEVQTRVEANFLDPVPRDRVRAVPELSDLTVVMQGQQGTNFSVSTEQASGLARLIAEFAESVPDIPKVDLEEAVKRRLRRDWSSFDKAVDSIPSAKYRKEVLDRFADVEPESVKSDHDQDIERLHGLAQQAVEYVHETSQKPRLRATTKAALEDVGHAARVLVRDYEQLADIRAPVEKGDGGRGVEPAERQIETLTAPDDPLIWPWRERDRMEIVDAVKNLARYIVHQDQVPPKAIGIFGDWGSGKTFFMDALKSHIASLSWQSRLAIDDGRRSAFCSRVVQIDFNAWHYVESNLWASLAGHIFERLFDELKQQKDEEIDANALFAALETYREATEARDKARQMVNTLTAKRAEMAKTFKDEQNAFAEVRRTIETEAGRKLMKKMGELTKQQRRRLDAVIPRDAFDDTSEATAQLSEVVAQGRGLAQQLATGMRFRGSRRYTIAVLTAAILLVGVPVAVTAIDGLISSGWSEFAEHGHLASFGVMLGTVITSASGVLAWLANRGRNLLSIVQTVRKFAAECHDAAEQECQKELKPAEEGLKEAQHELEQAELRLQAQKDELSRIQDHLQQQDPGVQLKSFLEERVRNQTYEQHLGLISLVRKDFEYLSDLMEKHWANRRLPRPFALIETRADDEKKKEQKVPFFERIVLYIDDLDRCPSDKVVDVLQAVHLLLGFKLFIVVVGVDVRWIGRSLLKQYPELLSDRSSHDENANGWESATSDDYLEKIFQIPFRLCPMDNATQQQLLSGLLGERFFEGRDEEGESSTVPKLELEPREFDLYDVEKEYIKELHACLGRSPRRVKRFVDLYRLMRSGMAEGDVETIIDGEQFREILALFALLSGSVHLGPRLLEELHAELNGRTGEIGKWSFCKWLDSRLADLEGYGEEETRSARRVFGFLDQIQEHRDITRGLCERIREVSCYSFREIRLSDRDLVERT